MATPSQSRSSGRGEDDNFEVAPSHRKETVGKRKTAKSSPPGDRKIERRKRCVTHPGFNIRASSTSTFEGPSSKLKASSKNRSQITQGQ
ncbi:hypothetical protein CK203_046657 [Vitis vinifera]|uniref:Uncharacterized protein n=1 Tax=Vitis vinifera TaxID=29760 RepID=A0A438HK15_VITVI|nr:hypothetical protein CK203_046657 [Vitis vinifera]